ncbi:hypothetical protein FGO68_gene11647 [Halteria grandinella]|uniref:Transmembrane protein n=1 Tax=Halteria grandinella TaxID=5974 RepID=A0A8J8NAM6_HALGN|nr:hypothetical protein FGO68_gene11647 [Halteria grandinella]
MKQEEMLIYLQQITYQIHLNHQVSANVLTIYLLSFISAFFHLLYSLNEPIFQLHVFKQIDDSICDYDHSLHPIPNEQNVLILFLAFLAVLTSNMFQSAVSVLAHQLTQNQHSDFDKYPIKLALNFDLQLIPAIKRQTL